MGTPGNCEHGVADSRYCRECAHPDDYDCWFEVTISRNRAAFARFGEAVLVTSATVRASYPRSHLEYDCLVGLPAQLVDRFRELARPVYMGPPARPTV